MNKSFIYNANTGLNPEILENNEIIERLNDRFDIFTKQE
jgi:hypothetical protein